MRKRHPTKARVLIPLAVILLAFAITAAAGAISMFRIFGKPIGKTVVFIPPGASFSKMVRILEDEGVLLGPWRIKLLARFTGHQRKLKPGEYTFDIPTPPYKILKILSEGKTVRYKVTFPEGKTMKDIAVILGQAKLAKPSEFAKACVDKRLLKEIGVPGSSFEGFLFPDTYYFSKLDTPKRIIRAMVGRFRQELTEEDKQKAKQIGFSLLEWVTLASIIEKESSRTDEHPIVSSVFHNRLKKRMRLQSDPTVIYGIKNFDGNLTRKHLETPTPYNTYTRGGLPPGPIANPSASALHAAVNPAKTEYYYFVGDREGRHVFSKTYAQHQENVAHYQLRRRR